MGGELLGNGGFRLGLTIEKQAIAPNHMIPANAILGCASLAPELLENTAEPHSIDFTRRVRRLAFEDRCAQPISPG